MYHIRPETRNILKQFADLFAALDQTNKTNEKVSLLKHYFSEAPEQDKLWALALFSHKGPRRQVNATLLRRWSAEAAGVPDWLFEESYHVVGDLAETMALLLPLPIKEQQESLAYWMDFIIALGNLEEFQKKEKILEAWETMTQQERFVFTKLMTGSFRIGVSQSLVVRAVAEVTKIERTVVAHRIMGNWQPSTTSFSKLVLEENEHDNLSRPYPFFLAHPVGEPEELGVPQDWQAEWKWDGIRAQLIIRKGALYLWSRGEDLITEKFPEFQPLVSQLPDGIVLDGEILPYKEGKPLSFALLQTRIGRKNLTKKILTDAPVVLKVYDILEYEGKDIRESPQQERRALLENVIASQPDVQVLVISPIIAFTDWQELAKQRECSREHLAEGIMLKRLKAPYQVGRKRGDWWKWKIDALSVDGVLIYAQKGHGRRADIYSDYTFAVWHEGQLVSFAKAYSGLTDQEMNKVDAFVKRNTKERFGPVRTVDPKLVFEIGFEGIQESNRHKSGVALRFPRILRWRHDKKADEANTLDELKELLRVYQNVE